MKKLLALIFIILICYLSAFCQKRWHKTIRLKGVCLDWLDKSRARCGIDVRAQDAHSHKLETVTLTYFENEDNGTFDKEVQAGRSGSYYIGISVFTNTNILRYNGIRISDGSTKDFDTLYASHRFTCQVHLLHKPANTQSIRFTDGSVFNQDSPADTVYYESRLITYDQRHDSYRLNYTLISAGSEDRWLTIPLGTSDTLKAEIAY